MSKKKLKVDFEAIGKTMSASIEKEKKSNRAAKRASVAQGQYVEDVDPKKKDD